MHVHMLTRILYLDIEYNIKFQTIWGPRTVLPLCKTYSKDRSLCVVCKSFAYQTRISNGEKRLIAFVILLASRKCLVTHAEVCICTSSQTRYMASTPPPPGVHHPRAAEKMWVNTFVMISPTHKFAIIIL